MLRGEDDDWEAKQINVWKNRAHGDAVGFQVFLGGKKKQANTCLLCLNRDNILVLDIFFEALNYETIEQKKAYELAGLLGMAFF